MTADQSTHYQVYAEAIEILEAAITDAKYGGDTRAVHRLEAVMDNLRAMRFEYDELALA